MSKTLSIQFLLAAMFIFLQQIANAQCTEYGNVWDKSWVSCSTATNPNSARSQSHWYLIEFDQAESINKSKIWNANRSGESSMGIKQMNVDYSIDGSTWISLGVFTVPRGPESPSYIGSDGPEFGGVFLKKILFTVISTYGHSSCASLAEVQFNIDPDVCYGIEDECGVCNGPGILTWYRDADADGLGDSDDITLSCTQPSGYVSNPDDPCDTGLYGWADIGPLFANNGCTGCHGTESGLDLRSYATLSMGGNKCGQNILTGNNLVGIITIEGFAGCASPIVGDPMNDRVNGQMDADEIAMIQEWIDSGAPEFCLCAPDAPDTDNDGICDNMDACPGFDNQLIGTPCNDGLICTINDMIDTNCNCTGQPAPDFDSDGVCNSQDAAPNEPCTADGTIDGVEPAAWIAPNNNDCDMDGIPVGQGDLDDFEACINQSGFLPSSECMCDTNVKLAGGRYLSDIGVGNSPLNGGGLPDGLPSGVISNSDEYVLGFPFLAKNTQICFQIGFAEVGGIAHIELNDIGTYIFENTAGLIDYELQEFCVFTLEVGPQNIVITKQGDGGMIVDGSTFEYCECSISDFEELSPDCVCPSNQFQFTSTSISTMGDINNPTNALGNPDGIMTGVIGHPNSLILSYLQLQPNSKICFTAGFNQADGLIHFEQSGTVYSFSNTTGNATYEPQEFCFMIPDVLSDNLLTITEYGFGLVKLDGSTVYACNPCQPNDNDSDGDGICDANDPCPDSVNDDSDNDGICDDIDNCIGFDDALDTDGDGVPNGCDLCPGGRDTADSDNDGVANACDKCPGGDDRKDFDNDGIPNACDDVPCLNFFTDLTNQFLYQDQAANFQILTNGLVNDNNDLKYRAGHTLLFEKGFEVNTGSTFTARILPCLN